MDKCPICSTYSTSVKCKFCTLNICLGCSITLDEHTNNCPQCRRPKHWVVPYCGNELEITPAKLKHDLLSKQEPLFNFPLREEYFPSSSFIMNFYHLPAILAKCNLNLNCTHENFWNVEITTRYNYAKYIFTADNHQAKKREYPWLKLYNYRCYAHFNWCDGVFGPILQGCIPTLQHSYCDPCMMRQMGRYKVLPGDEDSHCSSEDHQLVQKLNHDKWERRHGRKRDLMEPCTSVSFPF